MTGMQDRPIGCWRHRQRPAISCTHCRTESFGWLHAAVERRRAQIAAERAQTELDLYLNEQDTESCSPVSARSSASGPSSSPS